MTAARPGVLAASLVSSLTLTAQSQPQYTNTASRNESDRVRKEPVHGLSQAADTCPAPGRACPVPALTNAITANTPSAISSMASSACCSRADTSIPR